MKKVTHLLIRIAKSEIYFPSVLSFKRIAQIELRFGSERFGIRLSALVGEKQEVKEIHSLLLHLSPGVRCRVLALSLPGRI